MRLKIIILMATALFCTVLYFLFRPENPQNAVTLAPVEEVEPEQPPPEQSAGATDWQPPRLTADNYESDYGPLPESLKDTRIPFDIRVDDQNHLIIEASLRRLFDYFFTLVGEEDVAQIKLRIEEILNRYLPEPARSEALQIFQEYVRVKEGEIRLRDQLAADYEASGRTVDLYERVRLLRDLRQSTLSPEVYDAFYAEEDKRALYSLERHALMQDESLSLEERNAALRELDQQLPESLRQAKEEEYI